MASRDAILNIKVNNGASAPLNQIEAALASARGALGAFSKGLQAMDGPLSGATKGYQNLLAQYRSGGSDAVRQAEAANRRLTDAIKLTEAASAQAGTRVSDLRRQHTDLTQQLGASTLAIVEMHRRMREAPAGTPEKSRFAGLESAARAAQAAIQKSLADVSRQLTKGVSDVGRLGAELDQLKQRAGIAAGLMSGLRFSPDLSALGVAKARIADIDKQTGSLARSLIEARSAISGIRSSMASGAGTAAMRAELEQLEKRIRALREERSALARERSALSGIVTAPLSTAAARRDARLVGGQMGAYSTDQLRTIGAHRSAGGEIDRDMADLRAMVARRASEALRSRAHVGATERAHGFSAPETQAARRASEAVISAADIDRASASLNKYQRAIDSSKDRLRDLRSEGGRLNATYGEMDRAVKRQARIAEDADKQHRRSGSQADLDALDRQKAKLDALVRSRAQQAEAVNKVVRSIAQEEITLGRVSGAAQTSKKYMDELRKASQGLRVQAIADDADRARAHFASLREQIEKARKTLAELNRMPAGPARNQAIKQTRSDLAGLLVQSRALTRSSAHLRDLTPREGLSRITRLALGLDQVRGASERAGAGVGRLSKALNVFGTDARTALSLAQRVRGQLLSMAAAYVGVFAVFQQAGSVIQTFRDLEAAGARLNYVFDGNMERAGREMRYLREQADHFGLSLKQVTTDYTKFAAAATGAGMDNKGVRSIFEGVSAAARVNKLGSDQINRIYTALGQSISKNQVYSEELKGQLAESLPGAVTLFARAMGYGVDEMSKFNKALADGKFNADSVVKFGEYLSETFSGSLADVSDSFEARLNRFLNSIFDARTSVANNGFMDGLIAAMANLEKFFESDSGREYFARIGQASGAVLRGLSELVKYLDVALAVAFAAVGMKAIGIITGLLGGLRAAAMGSAGALGPLAFSLNAVSGIAQRATASISALPIAMRLGAMAALKLAGGVVVLTGAMASLLTVVGGPIGALFLLGTAAAAWWTSRSAKQAATARADFAKVSASIDKVRDSVAESKGSLEDFLATLEKVGKSEAVAEAEAARKSATDQINKALTDVAADRVYAEGNWLQSSFVGRNLGLAQFGQSGKLMDEIASGSDKLHNELVELITDFEKGEIGAKDFNARLEEMRDAKLIDEAQTVQLQKAGRAYVTNSRNARIMELRARMLTTSGKEQAKVFEELQRLTSDLEDATAAMGGEYSKLSEVMAGIGGKDSEFKEALNATGELEAIEEAAKAARTELEELRSVMSPERLAELAEGIGRAANDARRRSLADFVEKQAAKEGLEISIDAGTMKFLEDLYGRLEMTTAGLMRSSDLAAPKGVVNQGASIEGSSSAREWLKDIIRSSEGTGAPGKPWQAYKDQGGVLTIGYGHTNATGTYKFGEGDIIDKEIAERILDLDVGLFEEIVDRRVQVPITEAMRAALLHYLYNVGEGGGNRDGVFKALNEGEYASAQEAIRTGTATINGAPSQALRNRRIKESEIFGSQGLDPGALARGSAIRAQQATGEVALPVSRALLEATSRLQAIVPDMSEAANARLTEAVLQRPALLDNAGFRSSVTDGDVDAVAKALQDAGLKELAAEFSAAARHDRQKREDDKFDDAIETFNKSLNERGELSSKDLTKPGERDLAITTEIERILRGVTESGRSLEELTGKAEAAAMEDIRRAVNAQADLEQARQAREKAEKSREEARKKAEEAIEDKKDFDAETADAIRDADHAVKIAELNAALEEAKRLGDTAGQASVARDLMRAKVDKDIEDRERKSGFTVSDEDRARMLRAAEAELDIEQRITTQKMEQERLEHRISLLQSQRGHLSTQLDDAREAGDDGRIKELQAEIKAVEAQLLAASDAAVQFYEKLGGPESEAALQTQRELRYEIEANNDASKKFSEGIKAIADMISGHISDAFIDMAKNIAAGKNAFASLGVAVSQAVGRILMDIGEMIMRAVVAKAVLGALGIVAPPGSAMGNALASLGNGGTGLEQWFGGTHHDGGLVGDTKGESFGEAIARILNLRGNERVARLEVGEEVVTASDPRHRRNLGGSLRAMFAKYHTGGLVGMPADSSASTGSFAGRNLNAISGAMGAAGGGGDTKIVNAFDGTSFLNEALSSRDGERVIMNHVSANRGKWRAALGV